MRKKIEKYLATLYVIDALPDDFGLEEAEEAIEQGKKGEEEA
jgi:hypothetical protein